jgi:hypothetical protein
VNAEQAADEVRGRVQDVFRTVGNEIAPVGTEPDGESPGVGIGQCLFDLDGMLPGFAGVIEQLADRASYISAS